MGIKHLFFAKKFILPSCSANALQSLTMAYAFAAAGVRTTVLPGFKASSHAHLKKELEAFYGLEPTANLELKSLYGRHKGIYGLGFRFRLASAWLSAAPGTVFYSRDIKEALMLARLKRRFGLKHPFFFEMHEILAEQHRQNNTGRAEEFRKLEQELLEQVDGIIAISPLLAKDLDKEYAPGLPVHVAPMGFNDTIFSQVPDVNLSGDVVLAYAGSLYEGKGIHSLVAAMKYLPGRFRLLVMGGKPQEELSHLQRIAAEVPEGSRRIEFTGHLSPREVALRLQECQMFIIPQQSSAEFFSPIKLYEAMGVGLPMVVTPVPAISAVLHHGENAYFAKDRNPESIAHAVQELSADTDTVTQMQNNCREQAVSHTWKQRAVGCLNFMQTVLEHRE